MKKLFNLFLAFLILFTSIFYQPSKVSANPLAGAVVPAGVTVGAGAYTVGALILAGGLGIAGYADHQDTINNHAKNVWNNSTDFAKDSLNDMLYASAAAGGALVNVGEGLGDWISSNFNDISQISADSVVNLESLNLVTPDMYSAQSNGIRFNSNTFRFKIRTTDNSVNTTANLYLNAYSGNLRLFRSAGVNQIARKSFSNTDEALAYARTLTSLSAYLSFIDANSLSHLVSVSLYPTGNSVIKDQLDQMANQSVSRVREAWEGMKDAGLVLPVNDAVPYNGDTVMDYNATNDTYRFPSGILHNPSADGPIDWRFPQPGIYTDVNGKDFVGYPTRGDAVTGTDGFTKPGELTGDITDVFTGTNTGTGTINPPVEGDVTGFWSTLWQWLQNLLNAILGIPKAILNGLVSLFVPTVALSTLISGLVAALESKFNMPSEFVPILTGQSTGGSCIVTDQNVSIMGVKANIFKSDYLLTAANWYLPIVRGLMWFLFAWYCVRKFISLWNKTGGIQY